MKRFGCVYIFTIFFIVLSVYLRNSAKFNLVYYVDVGQAVTEREKSFLVCKEKKITKKCFKYLGSINIIEKILTLEVLLIIMSYVFCCHWVTIHS